MTGSAPLVYVDTSAVREGAGDRLEAAIEELAAFVEANAPEVIAYGVYLTDDRSGMSVVHVHRDSASLEHHLTVGGPVFRKFAELLTMSSIHVYGEPSARAVEGLHDKARMLGCEEVVVHPARAGFERFGGPGRPG